MFDPWKNQIDEIDVCHFYSCSYTMYDIFAKAKDKMKPVLWSPIFNVFNMPMAQMIAKAHYISKIPGVLLDWKMMKYMANCTDTIIALNTQEASRLQAAFQLNKNNIKIIPNGIERIFATGDQTLFKNKYNIDNFILNVAYIGPIKNQMNLIKAVNGTSMNLVLIGSPIPGQESYLEKCKKIAGENILFVGSFPFADPMLLSAYSSAHVFALPSFTEVMAISLLEAATAGCNLVTSNKVPIVNYLQNYVIQSPPNNYRKLRDALNKATKRAKDKKLQKLMLSKPTWPDVAIMLKQLYEKHVSLRQYSGTNRD